KRRIRQSTGDVEVREVVIQNGDRRNFVPGRHEQVSFELRLRDHLDVIETLPRWGTRKNPIVRFPRDSNVLVPEGLGSRYHGSYPLLTSSCDIEVIDSAYVLENASIFFRRKFNLKF